MSTEEKITVMQAFVDKKKVEILINNKWEEMTISDPTWGWGVDNYRIKQEPEYIPFDFSDAENLIGKIVKHKETKSLSVITNVNPKNVTSSGTVIHYDVLFSKYEYPDGSICGKLKQ